jgi:hypothetical protein
MMREKRRRPMKRFMILAVVLLVAVAVCVAVYAADAKAKNTDIPKGSQISPKKVTADTNYDGKPDRVEYYDESGRITKAEVDANGDGMYEESVIYSEGKPVKSTRDTNNDGKPDVWIDF